MFARNFLHPNPLHRVEHASDRMGWSRGNDPAFRSVTH
jgi:hypothetical protein